MNNSVLINQLTVSIKDRLILDGVSLVLAKGDAVALVGESGSGKTTMALSLLRLLAASMTMKAHQIEINGQSLITMTEKKLSYLRGSEVGFVFQEPLAAFDPLFTIGFHLDETLRVHTDFDMSKRRQRIHEVLTLVGLPDINNVLPRYPHQLSGGQRQRAMMALACVCYPSLLIADEPTSNLDYHMQEHILKAFKHLRQTLKMSMIIITHDLGIVKDLTEQVVVLKEGRIVESGLTERVLKDPQHAYTRELIEASIYD